MKPLALVLPRNGRHMTGDKLHRAATLLSSTSEQTLYGQLISHWADPGAIVVNSREPPSILTAPPQLPETGYIEQMMALDSMSYLPDDILVKVDRAAMGVSLETRVPYLDHRVFEFAWKLPRGLKLREGQTKWVLRQVLYRHVPRGLVERPKMGFGIPIDSWLRGPLREWAEDMLSESRLRQEGFLNPKPVRSKWVEHQSGRRNWQFQLWGVLMFQAWIEEQQTTTPGAANLDHKQTIVEVPAP